MAEVAPLSLAHAHARKATVETVPAQCADEHTHAAVQYARAARTTNDFEALRILRLLEDQHLKLASIIKNHDSPANPDPASTELKHPDRPRKPSETTPLDKNNASPKPRATARVESSQIRDSSPSLARDIATRRGIPQSARTTPSAVVQARASQTSPERRRHSRATPGPSIPPSIMDSQNLSLGPAGRAKKAEDDDAFSKFYSNLTTGTMSKLSSVLAYAGLPLTTEEVQNEQSSKARSSKHTVSASTDPDVKKIFSKAALNAIEDEHRQRGARGHVFGPAESFYVVQKGGGTYSYADIAKAPKSQTMGIDEEDEEMFQDARENPTQPSPLSSSRQSKLFVNQPQVTSKSGLSHEELELENGTLKQMLEKVATRLQNFESHAQDASMAALTQSMASLKPANSPSNPDAAMQERIKQLEQLVERQAEEKQELATRAAKQEKSLKKYKAQWGDIVKGAKEREKAKKEKAERTSDETTGADVDDGLSIM